MADSRQKHMVQLDGLRAIAVLFVLVAHFHPREHPIRTFLPWGEMGVQLFFVLSGFLITSILLRCRRLIDDKEQSLPGAVRQFYIRRCLRIFPLYYLTLLVLLWLDYTDVRASFGWHLSYFSNVYFILTNSGHGHIAHFWTLAVEEQFYLTWPLLVLVLPRRGLLPLILAIIASAPLFRLGVSVVLPPEYYHARLWAPFANLDSLGMGALLALLSETGNVLIRYREPVIRIGTWVGTILLGVYLVLYAAQRLPPGVEIVLSRFFMGLFFLALIGRAATGFAGAFGRFLAWSPLVYIGKISYGIYVVHFFVPDLLDWIFGVAGWHSSLSIPASFFLNTAASLLLATLTWYVIENPINGFKRLFTYEGLATNVMVQPAMENRGVELATKEGSTSECVL